MIIDLNPNPATQKQLDYIDALRYLHGILPLTAHERELLSFDDAYDMIDKLKVGDNWDDRA